MKFHFMRWILPVCNPKRSRGSWLLFHRVHHIVTCINTPCSVDGVCLEDVELETFFDAEEEDEVADPQSPL